MAIGSSRSSAASCDSRSVLSQWKCRGHRRHSVGLGRHLLELVGETAMVCPCPSLIFQRCLSNEVLCSLGTGIAPPNLFANQAVTITMPLNSPLSPTPPTTNSLQPPAMAPVPLSKNLERITGDPSHLQLTESSKSMNSSPLHRASSSHW